MSCELWVVGYRLLVAGCWLLVAGCWLLVAGCWLGLTRLIDEGLTMIIFSH